MKTPITDAAETKRMDPDVAVVYGTVPAHVARRLELDRAALMNRLEDYALPFEDEQKARAEFGDFSVNRELLRRAALAAACANFP